MLHEKIHGVEYDDTTLVRCPNDFEGELYIPDGITIIQEEACAYCPSLTSVSLPDTIKSIEPRAFANCPALTNVTLRGKVKHIFTEFLDDSPFAGCESLKQITLNDDCTKLNAVCRTIPRLEKFVISEKHPAFSVINGLLYNKKRSKLLACPCGLTGTVEIAEGVKEIADEAFLFCDNVTRVLVPEGVATIDRCVFEGMYSLKEITLPKSLSTVSVNAFACCDKLSKVKYNGTVEQWYRIQFDDDANPLINHADLYIGGKPLKELTIPGSITEINRAFMGCSSIEKVIIPDSAKTIEEKAFYYCKNLAHVCVGDGVTTIQSNAFSDCKKLKSIFIPAFAAKIEDGIAKGCGSVVIYCEGEPQEWWSEDWNKKNWKSKGKHDVSYFVPRDWYEKFVFNNSTSA